MKKLLIGLLAAAPVVAALAHPPPPPPRYLYSPTQFAHGERNGLRKS